MNDAERSSDAERVGVLFMQSQEFFGADSQIHASIMTHLDRSRFHVHCAHPREVRGDPTPPSTVAVRRLHDVTLRATDFGGWIAVRSPLVVVATALRKGLPVAWSLAGLVRHVRRNRIRIVHCTEKPRDAVLGTLVAALGGARCVIHLHVKAETWISSAVRRSMRRAAALIGVSEFVSGSIRDLGYDPERVHTVLNGLEVDEWRELAARTDPTAVRDEFGIAPDAPLIVSAARLYRYKGQHDLLAALPSVIERVPDVRVLIVGKDDPRGFPGEESYSAALRRMCDELQLWDHVVFTGWRSDVPALMAASDLYVMPSFEEPFGMVYVESMFLRRPVVSLDNGGTREAVVDGETGLLSEPGDVSAIADNIVTLLTDDELRREMGEAGHRRVVDVLNSRRMADEVAAVYEAVLAGR